MAAIALMGSVIMGCSENDFLENTSQGKAVTLTTTISLDGSSATTRALDADGKKTFAAGEQVALIYEDANNGVQKIVSAALQGTDITNEGKTATLTFAFEKAPKANGNFTMIYPASMAKEPLPTSGEFGDIAAPNYTGLATQNGTLASLASKLDLATSKSVFTSDATLPGGISLTNQLAILELTSITDYTGTNDLTSTITGLTVKVGDGASAPTYTVSRTAAAGPIYVAMQPCSESDITITATTSTANYEKTVSSQSLSASTMTPVTAKMHKIVDLALQTSDYEAQNGDILTGTLGTKVKISIAGGAAITLRNANINMKDNGNANWTSGSYAGITCKGDATIILEGINKVHGFANNYPGIQAAHNDSGDEYTLTIKGEGEASLEATGSSEAAGIGSGYQGKCGNITIEGGTITAKGDYGAAGIGSGQDGKCDAITISGGTITATGGSWAAGIGSGYNGACGAITIKTGATIEEAKGKGNGAGIGSGRSGTCDAITISGGTITSAYGGTYGAGIGSGDGGTCVAITISGGTITSAQSGGYGAGIGSGAYGTCDAITISGGTITSAYGGSYGAGIGSGSGANANCGDITISGGTITNAKGGSFGAGIGSGANANCGDITITTGVTQVTATKGTSAPNSIGKGYGSSTSPSTCGTVTIGCTLDGSGNPVGGTQGEISVSPYTYQPVSQ